MSRETLTVTDNRTGESFELAIENSSIRADDLTEPFATDDGPGLVVYDPGFLHTASCRSSITNINLRRSLLEHRGYLIEELAEQSTFLEVAYLLINGELPTAAEFEQWKADISTRKFVHENIKAFIQGFRYDAHPMTMLGATVGALASFYPDAGEITDGEARRLQILRLIGKMPTLATHAYRRGNGQPYVHPVDDLSYVGNILSMMFRMSELSYKVDPRVEKALDTLLIVHADHEQSAATTAVRAVGSNGTDPYAAVAAGVYALSGPNRGAADTDTLAMLREIGSPAKVPAFLETVKNEGRLMGFGHWVYRSPDPRAAIVRARLEELHEVTPPSPLVAIADELAKRAAEDEYFVSRGIYPNVDLYTGLTYQAIGIPESMFGVMFAIARSAGWIAQWLEMVLDPEQHTVRPRQIYVGPAERKYVPLTKR